MRTVCLGVLLCVSACGPTEAVLGEGGDEGVGSIGQEGKTAQGKTAQGKTAQGKTAQGKTAQGTWASGTVFIVNRGAWKFRTSAGTTVTATGTVSGTQLVGTSPFVSALSTTFSADQTGSMTFDALKRRWVTSGLPLVQMYAQPLEVDGTIGTIRSLRVVNTWTDSGPLDNPAIGFRDAQNMLEPAYRAAINSTATPNSDIRFYKVQMLSADGKVWEDFCKSPELGNRAIFTAGYFNAAGTYVKSNNPQHIGVTCWDGTAAKCMRWGYRPWRSLNHPTAGVVPLEPVWQACVRAARADYCGNGESYTDEGRQIDLWDRYGFIAKSPESSQWVDSGGVAQAYSDESAFDARGAVCLVRERLYTSNFNTATCPIVTTYVSGGEYCFQPPTAPSGTWSQCAPKGATSAPTNIFDRGQLSTCDAVATRPPLVYIASYDSGCSSHAPNQTGRALGADCNCITKSVCGLAGAPVGGHAWKECCAEDSEGHLIDGKWDAQCVQKAQALAMSAACVAAPIVVGGFR